MFSLLPRASPILVIPSWALPATSSSLTSSKMKRWPIPRTSRGFAW
jgi:hypothetical protein